MNPNYGKMGGSLNNFDFDLGIGTNRSRSLNDQKNKPNSYGSSYSSASSYSQSGARPGMGTTGAPSWQPNKPSWVHQPAPASTGLGVRSELGGPTSMVGDIFGKSWNSVTPAKTGAGVGVGVGVASKDPGLFKDLVSSAMGQNKSNGNAPLKSSAPAATAAKSSFSMGAMSDSLPAATGSVKGGGSSWGSSEKFGSYTGASNSSTSSSYGYGANGMNKGTNSSVSSMRGSGSALGGGGIGGGGSGLGASLRKDPFSGLWDIGSKPSSGAGLDSAGNAKPTSSGDYSFGDFPNASMSAASKTPLSAFPYNNNISMGSNQTQSQQSGSDSFDMFFPPSSGSSFYAKPTPEQSGNQQSSGGDDWGFNSDFGGGHDVGSTTELDGLPPPPAGVSASSAKSKGLDNYKQGQYADAIKWLSWALVLLEKAGDANSSTEVLTCRASCYKEVGEYKKAVADCTTVLGHEGENVAVLVQRALLYESMEKYKLGAEDLRTVMKLDPGNKLARSTIHRLTKMID